MSNSIIHPTGEFDNAARNYQHIEVVPLAAAMGAEICGVDLKAISSEVLAEIENALYHHKMIYFSDQEISHHDQEAFTLMFGEFGIDAYTTGAEGHNNVQPVVKEANAKTKMVFGSGWHTDSPFLKTPPAISMVYGVDIPPFGGDTIWCNAALAYRFLSQTMREVIAPLKVHMSARDVVTVLNEIKREDAANQQSAFDGIEMDEQTRAMVKGSMHPLVRSHPKTGEKSLYVDQTYAKGIEGMTEPEAMSIINFLVAHLTQPAFSCRLRWQKNTFVVWDNRLCVHQAFNDYDGYRRELYRTTVMGEVPA